MNPTNQAIKSIDNAIAVLEAQKLKLIESIPLADRIVTGTWIIKKNQNKYYQAIVFNANSIVLRRNGFEESFNLTDFNQNFRIADKWEIEQHLDFLKGKQHAKEQAQKPQLPEFYMITVKGERGATVRHESFEIAVKEATRLSKKTEHRAHILGVVGIVEPTVVQQPIVEYQLIK